MTYLLALSALALLLSAWAAWRLLTPFGPGQGSSVSGVTFQAFPSVIPVAASSGNVAATATTATLAAAINKVTWIEGFDIMGLGATGASEILVTVTGLASGTQTFELFVPAGAAVLLNASGQPFGGYSWRFPTPLPAGTGGSIASNTAIVVNVPSFGAGNTNAAVVAYGFQV